MRTDGPLRLAVVGCGAVVERFHLPALRRVAGVKLCALVEKDPRRLRWLGLKYPGTRLCRHVDELPQEAEAALVAVPNALHAPIAINLLRRGIHVLCEKPLATTVEECRETVQAAARSGAALMVGHHKRFLPNVRKARELLDLGHLGVIVSVTGSMGLPRTWRSRTAYHLDRSLAGGGVLLDNGVHLIDVVLWLVGAIHLRSSYTLPEASSLEEDAKVEFNTAGGAVGVLRFSHTKVLANVLRIQGERGFLEFDTYDYPSLKLFVEGASLCRTVGSVVFTWPKTNPYQCQLEHFVRFIRGMEPILLNAGQEALKAVSVVAEAYARVGR